MSYHRRDQIGMFIERRVARSYWLVLSALASTRRAGGYRRAIPSCVNPARLHVLGSSQAEPLSRRYMGIVHPDDVELTAC